MYLFRDTNIPCDIAVILCFGEDVQIAAGIKQSILVEPADGVCASAVKLKERLFTAILVHRNAHLCGSIKKLKKQQLMTRFKTI